MEKGFLSIGHCCHDKHADGFILGGTASYSAMIAKAWDMDAKILTSVSDDFQFTKQFENLDIPFHNVKSTETTCFHNIYLGGQRTQYLLSRAATITSEHVPKGLENSSIILFGLIADEVNESLLKAFPKSLKASSIQGFLRQWDEHGLVSPKAMDWRLLEHLDLVILSDEDIKGVEEFLPLITQHCKQVVLTHGSKGATVYHKNETLFFPSFPTIEVDPTGAGDVFTTAYTIEFKRSKNIHSACIFAHCAASFVIEGIGISNLPSIDMVNQRKDMYRKKFNIS